MTLNNQRAQAFERIAHELGYDFSGDILIGGRYVPLIEHQGMIEIAGQIPRVGQTVVATGRVGAEIDLTQAQTAAKVCVLRAIALLNAHLGDLARVDKILRMNVFIQCTNTFTQHSEVADGASDVLYAAFGEAGIHTRTSVGVFQLPKNASVELDLRVAVK